ncbi:MAG: ABC transporter permease [Candidatus Bathyarchaeia archaeon]
MSRDRLYEFWSAYRRSRLGILGLAVLLLFIIMALTAPFLTPYDPIHDKFLAEGSALPAWFRIFPQYSSLPETMYFNVAPKVDGGWAVRLDGPVVLVGSEPLTFTFQGGDGGEVSGVAEFIHKFNYEYSPPHSFRVNMSFNFLMLRNVSYTVELFILNPESDMFLVWSSGSGRKPLEPPIMTLDSKVIPFELKSRMGLEWYRNVAEHVFSRRGSYTLLLRFRMEGEPRGSSIFSLTLGRLVLHIPGRVHGVLGTDHLGSDLFSQLLYGSRVSLFIGISAAVISVVIGLFCGLVAGYYGRVVDEVAMRLVDVLLVLPGLPMLMILSSLLGRSVWNIVFLLGVLSWPGFARVVRAQVLQLKTAAFIEASRSIGSSGSHIIMRHLLPNVLPLAYATVALSIPSAIMAEAALSFLALGDPDTPSWGRMFYSAHSFGAFQHLAWWWIVPPGVAITLLSLSFVFIGTTIDEVLNPRLRVRRQFSDR